jgi:hypothetical protein
VETLKEAF